MQKITINKLFTNLTSSMKYCHGKTYRGFTLAEVLVSLTILGIVASITMSSVISSYQERTTITKVKKMYYTLNSAYTNALAYNQLSEGTIFGFNQNGAENIADILKQYLAVSMDCGTSRDAGAGKTGKINCGMNDDSYKKINGSDWNNYTTDTRYYALKLKDGSLIWFRGYKDNTIAFWVDVNGSKAPNTFGKDVFHFAKYGTEYPNQDQTSVSPVGNNSPEFKSRCTASNADGMGCTAWLIYKGNRDYLKCRSELEWDMNKCP